MNCPDRRKILCIWGDIVIYKIVIKIPHPYYCAVRPLQSLSLQHCTPSSANENKLRVSSSNHGESNNIMILLLIIAPSHGIRATDLPPDSTEKYHY